MKQKHLTLLPFESVKRTILKVYRFTHADSFDLIRFFPMTALVRGKPTDAKFTNLIVCSLNFVCWGVGQSVEVFGAGVSGSFITKQVNGGTCSIESQCPKMNGMVFEADSIVSLVACLYL